MPFSRTEEGKIYQRAFGGMTTRLRRRPARAAHLRRRRPHRPRHAAHAVRPVAAHEAEFFIEYFALDLIMDDEGACRGVMAMCIEDGTIHRFRAHHTILATGGYGRAYFSCTSRPYLHRRRQRHGAARRPAPAGYGIRPVPSHRHLRRRRADHRRRARRRRLSHQFRRRALHGALCAARQGSGLARRGFPRDDHRNPRRPRRRAGEGPHPPASRPSGPENHGRAPARHHRERENLCRRRSAPRADPGSADGALQYGRHPDQLSRRNGHARRRRSRRGRAGADGHRRGVLRVACMARTGSARIR